MSDNTKISITLGPEPKPASMRYQGEARFTVRFRESLSDVFVPSQPPLREIVGVAKDVRIERAPIDFRAFVDFESQADLRSILEALKMPEGEKQAIIWFVGWASSQAPTGMISIQNVVEQADRAVLMSLSSRGDLFRTYQMLGDCKVNGCGIGPAMLPPATLLERNSMARKQFAEGFEGAMDLGALERLGLSQVAALEIMRWAKNSG